MAGRPRKPTALKVLEGNPGKRALPKAEPAASGGAPPAPRHLCKEARAEWDRLSRQLDRLGLLVANDLAAFAAYCELYAEWVKAKRVIQRKGMTYTVNGIVRMRPEVKITRDAVKEMRQYGNQFGLSPSARAKVASAIVNNPNQPLLPGLPPPAEDPAKPQPPTLPPGVDGKANLSDDDFLGSTRH